MKEGALKALGIAKLPSALVSWGVRGYGRARSGVSGVAREFYKCRSCPVWPCYTLVPIGYT